jgi:hypothetical protein
MKHPEIEAVIVLQPTMNLRWKRTTRETSVVVVEHIDKLEQLWICRNTGKQEWREIPIEDGEE